MIGKIGLKNRDPLSSTGKQSADGAENDSGRRERWTITSAGLGTGFSVLGARSASTITSTSTSTELVTGSIKRLPSTFNLQPSTSHFPLPTIHHPPSTTHVPLLLSQAGCLCYREIARRSAPPGQPSCSYSYSEPRAPRTQRPVPSTQHPAPRFSPRMPTRGVAREISFWPKKRKSFLTFLNPAI
jgi:hypothetical protein